MTYPAILDRSDLPAVFRSARRPRPNHALTGKPETLETVAGGQPLTPNQIKHNLRKQGHTLKSWSEANGFKYRDVSEVIRGIRRGNYGTGREIRLKLGLPVDEQLAA